MGARLPEGIYELLVTQGVRVALEALSRENVGQSVTSLEETESTALLARHVVAELLRGLEALRGERRVAAQIALCNELLTLLRERTRVPPPESDISPDGQVLLAVYRSPQPPARTTTPLSISSLLTGAADEPRLGAELAREIATADQIDALVSFITWEGWRRLQEAFEAFSARGGRLRLLTTTYTGATEAEAVHAIARLPGAQVRVSYDGRRTRLHAKAWLFHRNSGFSTAYVGSANLSRAALGSGIEWSIKVSRADLPHVLAKFEGTFDSLWEDVEFEPYTADDPACAERLRRALDRESQRPSSVAAAPMLFVTLQPYPFQAAILDALEAERQLHGRHRNLIVAATGTGKTFLAAFDYHHQAERMGTRPRLLFVAHRKELLVQAQQAFRHVLRDAAFGALLAEGSEPGSYEHLFTTVQSFSRRGLLDRLGPDYWHMVIIDECHHAPAPTFRDIVERIQPRILLGLTATPERADGMSLLEYFGGRPAAEMRLWHALERQLLAPFEYHGIHDGVDLRRLRWSRGSYELSELEQVYTGHHHRADLILTHFHRLRGRVREARALGFCVSVAHAEFMARRFSEAGIPALAVHGGSSDEVRQHAPRKLQAREVNILFTCDLYNEGIDLPFVDTLLLLRPTSSATVFLQQLGRGLRVHTGKNTCLVLDFIGQHRQEFRFDRTLTALTGVSRGRLESAVREGFPALPSGCHIQLDAVAREIVLDHLKQALGGGRSRLARELREIAAQRGQGVGLAEFLEDSGRPLEEVYEAGGFTALRRSAGLLPAEGPTGEEALGKRLWLLTHIDDPDRLKLYARLFRGELSVAGLGKADWRRLLMLAYQLYREPERMFTPATVLKLFKPFPELREELEQLTRVLSERVSMAATANLPADWTLSPHRTYSRREILTAVGNWTEKSKPESREGVRRIGRDCELLFVTLVKEEKHFSPTTRYRDYAISPLLFHWQSQSGTSEASEAGQRYIRQRENGNRFFLFVRKYQDEPFRFLGPVRYVTHSGSRPLSITWKLDVPIPAALFQEYATLLAA